MKASDMHTINFEIGDWSKDGHNESESIRVFSNHPVKRLREAHFQCPEKLGFDIGDICGEYEESSIDEDIIEALEDAGFDVDSYDPEYPGTRNMIQLWVDILMFIDPELELTLETPEELEKLPNMHFYGYDEKKRHLRVPGYGLFGF